MIFAWRDFFILYFYCSRVTCSIKQFVRSSWYQLILDYPPFQPSPFRQATNFLYRSRPQAKHCNFLCICQKWWIGLIKHPISIHSNLIIFKFQKFTFNLKRFWGYYQSFCFIYFEKFRLMKIKLQSTSGKLSCWFIAMSTKWNQLFDTLNVTWCHFICLCQILWCHKKAHHYLSSAKKIITESFKHLQFQFWFISIWWKKLTMNIL